MKRKPQGKPYETIKSAPKCIGKCTACNQEKRKIDKGGGSTPQRRTRNHSAHPQEKPQSKIQHTGEEEKKLAEGQERRGGETEKDNEHGISGQRPRKEPEKEAKEPNEAIESPQRATQSQRNRDQNEAAKVEKKNNRKDAEQE